MLKLKLTQLLQELILLTGLAQTLGMAIPANITDAITKVMSILSSVSFDFTNPNSVASVFHDVEILLIDGKAIAMDTPLAEKIGVLLTDVEKFPVLVHDIVTGQVITLLTAPMSVDGKSFDVKVFATRADSEESRHLGE